MIEKAAGCEWKLDLMGAANVLNVAVAVAVAVAAVTKVRLAGGDSIKEMNAIDTQVEDAGDHKWIYLK